MPEIRQIPTRTSVNVVNTVIEILTVYDPTLDLPAIISLFIADEVGIEEGVNYTEGDLIIRFKTDTFGNTILVSINSQGELVIESDDVNRYSINTNGELIYDLP